MPSSRFSRRNLVKAVGALAGGPLLCETVGCKPPAMSRPKEAAVPAGGPADYTLTIAVKPVELAPNRIVSTTTYNGQFPGPLLRFKEGQPVTIDINNQTDTPEQLHWHGQFLSTDVDREVVLTLKEFEPVYSRGGDMAMDFLLPATMVKEVKDSGENAMKDSLAKGMPHGFEVGYGSFTINGRML